MLGEAALLADMDASDRDIAEGRTFPISDVLDDLTAALDRTEVRRRARSG